jgi:antitoxin (DNA-binding transcriptional repressor) of toxin-antitoxin stability system
MTTVTMREAKNKFTELARRVESGETIIVTRYGKPVMEMIAPKFSLTKVNEAIQALKKKYGVDSLINYVAPDFDAPLSEDFLSRPLPEATRGPTVPDRRATNRSKGRPGGRARA